MTKTLGKTRVKTGITPGGRSYVIESTPFMRVTMIDKPGTLSKFCKHTQIHNEENSGNVGLYGRKMVHKALKNYRGKERNGKRTFSSWSYLPNDKGPTTPIK